MVRVVSCPPQKPGGAIHPLLLGTLLAMLAIQRAEGLPPNSRAVAPLLQRNSNDWISFPDAHEYEDTSPVKYTLNIESSDSSENEASGDDPVYNTQASGGLNSDNISGLNQRRLENGLLLNPEDLDGKGASRNFPRDTSQVNRDTNFQKEGGTHMDHRASQRIDPHSTFGEEMQADGIVFPGERNSLIPRIPSECKGSTFCETVTSYPEHDVSEAIRRDDSLKKLAIEDVVFDTRIGEEDEPLCVSYEQVIYPKIARNTDDEWRFIINNKNYKQGIRVEMCKVPDATCNVINNLAEGYSTSCRQKYVYRVLASLKPNGTASSEKFKMAASCCCHVKFIGSPLQRIGIDVTKQTPAANSQRRK